MLGAYNGWRNGVLSILSGLFEKYENRMSFPEIIVPDRTCTHHPTQIPLPKEACQVMLS
jgi:hypothetical protein